MIKVYTASRLAHAPLLKALRHSYPSITWTARWPDLVGKVDDSPENATWFWVQDEEDVRKADVVLVYGLDDDVLRGALVEAGMGIALGKRIICVGKSPSLGTWQYHPLVSRVAHLAEAFKLLEEWNAQRQ